MSLILIMAIPVLVIFGIGKLVNHVNPQFDSDDPYTRYRLPRILLIFGLLAIVAFIAYSLS